MPQWDRPVITSGRPFLHNTLSGTIIACFECFSPPPFSCPPESRARKPQPSCPPDCVGLELVVVPHVFQAPGSVRVVAIDLTNPTERACTLRPDGGPAQGPPLVLASGETAHTSFRWSTQPMPKPEHAGDFPKPSPGCTVLPGRAFGVNHGPNNFLLVSPTLLTPICSEVRYDAYFSGPFHPDWPFPDRLIPRPPAVALSTPKPVYDLGERIPLHLLLSDLNPVPPLTEHGCPVLFRSVREPSGFIRIDEVIPNHQDDRNREYRVLWATRCSGPDRPGPLSDPLHLEYDLEPSQIDETSPKTVRFHALAATLPSGELPLPASNEVSIAFRDPATLERVWGSPRDGVRVDLTLDKLTYHLGEDIPLHIAAQAVSGEPPVYAEPDRIRVAFDQPFPKAFHLTLTDEHGALIGSTRQSNLWLIPMTSGGPLFCPAPVTPGAILPLEVSAQRVGVLPTKPGTYRLSVSWSPYSNSNPTCQTVLDGSSPHPESPPEPQPFVTVTSAPLVIRIADQNH